MEKQRVELPTYLQSNTLNNLFQFERILKEEPDSRRVVILARTKNTAPGEQAIISIQKKRIIRQK